MCGVSAHVCVCVCVCVHVVSVFMCVVVCVFDQMTPLQISFLPQFTPLSPSHLSIVIPVYHLVTSNPKVSVLDWHVSSSCQPAGQALLVLISCVAGSICYCTCISNASEQEKFEFDPSP